METQEYNGLVRGDLVLVKSGRVYRVISAKPWQPNFRDAENGLNEVFFCQWINGKYYGNCRDLKPANIRRFVEQG